MSDKHEKQGTQWTWQLITLIAITVCWLVGMVVCALLDLPGASLTVMGVSGLALLTLQIVQGYFIWADGEFPLSHKPSICSYSILTLLSLFPPLRGC